MEVFNTVSPYAVALGTDEDRFINTLQRVGMKSRNELIKLPVVDSISTVIDDVQDTGILGLDFEWSVNTSNSQPHTLGIASSSSCIGIPINSSIKELILDIFSDDLLTVVGHNLTADVQKYYSMFDAHPKCKFIDTLILLRELLHDVLPDQSLEYLSYYELFLDPFKVTNDKEFFNEPSPLLSRRCAGDAYAGVKLYEMLKESNPDLYRKQDIVRELDMGLIAPISYAMYNGISLDMDKVSKQSLVLREELSRLSLEFTEKYGINNPSSPAQVKEALQANNIKVDNTSKETLSMIDTPLTNMVLEYRGYEKLYNTFCKNVEDILGHDNRVHCNYNIAGAVTGRFTCSKPNLQQIPPSIREIFKSTFGDDGILISLDKSQAELRVLGYLSNSKTIMDSYNQDIDYHTMTANLTGISRRDAKTLNFAFAYKASESTLVSVLTKTGISLTQAKTIVKKYLKTMSELGILKYQSDLIKLSRRNGYVASPLNRIGITLSPTVIVNFPTQSFTHDCNKETIIEIYTRFVNEGLKSRIWGEVHDSVELDVCIDEYDKVKNIINTLDSIYIPDILDRNIKMKLPVDITEHGSNWNK